MKEDKGEELAAAWDLLAASVRGAKHIRDGLVNQDAYNYRQEGDILALAVADGHGSLKHFRSQIGSKLAVEVAVELLLEEGDIDNFDPQTIPLIEGRVREKLPLRIVNSWRERVKEYHQEHPFNQDLEALEKLESIEKKNGLELRKKLEESSEGYLKAYGSTLIAVLLTEHFILYLQLGDGDIVTMSAQGEINRVFEDEQFGNATESLSMSAAERNFELALNPLSGARPLLFFIATDGYSNSFKSEDDFFQVAQDFAELLPSKGPDFLEENIELWLEQTTEAGSGDDISLILAYRKELLAEEEPAKLEQELMAKIKEGNLAEIEELLAQGVDPNLRDQRQRTPLLKILEEDTFAKRQELEILNLIELLLENGAELNIQDHLGLTPLMLAGKNSARAEIVTYLLAEGAQINLESQDGKRAVDFILANQALGETKVAQILIEKRKDEQE